MSKSIAIVYWTGTGNTEEMARALEAGVAAAGAEARVVPVADFSAEDVSGYDALAFGCPAMGAEELESDEFEPVWEACVGALGDKPVALFGSYGWRERGLHRDRQRGPRRRRRSRTRGCRKEPRRGVRLALRPRGRAGSGAI